ncbi:MAG: sulfotransferase family 2 domain-containing protein [Chromatiales bacterium]
MLGPLVVLVHTPKAGGTTFKSVLKAVYGDRLLVANPAELSGADLARRIEAQRLHYQAFAGHHPYGIHEIFRRSAAYLSTVRDPVARFESCFNFVKRWPAHRHHARAKSMSIGEFYRFLRDSDDISLFNLQCLMICRRKDLAMAREYVATRYLAVVPVTAIEPTIRYVAGKLNWPAINVPTLNVTEHKSLVSELTEADRRELAAGNQADADLVKFCEDATASRHRTT